MDNIIQPSLLRKYLKTTLTWLIFSIVLGFSLLYNPNLIINPVVLKWGSYFLNSDKFSVKWNTLKIHIKSESLIQKQLNISSQNLCFKGAVLNGCIEDFKIIANFRIDQPFFIQTIEYLKAYSQNFQINEISREELSNKKLQREPLLKIDWSEFNHKEVDVLIKNFKYLRSSKSFNGSIKIKGNKNYQGEIVLNNPEIIERASLTFNLFDLTLHKLETWSGDLTLNLFDESKKLGGSLRANFKNLDSSLNLKFQINPLFEVNNVKFSGPWVGTLNSNSLNLELKSQVQGLSFLPQITLNNCFIKVYKSHEVQYKTTCRIISDIELPFPKRFPDVGIPKFSGLDLSGDFKQSSFNSPLEGFLNLKLDDIETPLFKGKASSQTFVKGTLNDFPKNFDLNTEVDFTLKMENFKTLIAKLKKTNWAIPAPLNQLSGPISFGVRGQSNINQGIFPFFFDTDLKSKFQKVKIDGHGELILNLSKFLKKEKNNNSKHQLNLNLDLSEIILALPRMKLEAPPALFPDSRIAKFLPKKEKQITADDDLDYSVKIRTKGEPIKIISNLISTVVPINLEANFSSQEPFSGNIALGNFPVEIFKRKANVDFLKLDFKPNKHPEISGQVRVKYVDYDIGINLFGTTEKPLVKIDSDPVLTQEEALAVLLYGRTLQDLDTDQQESVGNTRSALADQSLGLASLYLLASTPIESLGYNEETREVSAKVKIGDGTSLNLGSGAGGSRVGIRRRISKNFTITTDYRREDFTDNESGVKNSSSAVETLIEWSLRY